ncbi:hypothetical protein ACROYT_G034784 [Oculina patagonica]
MRVVALISGGKDSCYNMMQCVQQGHVIVALANLKPSDGADELDSYMYQTVGHNAIDLYAQAMDLPLYRGMIKGSSVDQGKVYTENQLDEVEDLYKLLKNIKEDIAFDAVSVGAILSDYQRVRVENVCSRLGLSSLAYLWRRDQTELLSEMISSGVKAVLIKVAAMDLSPKRHLGLPISEVYSLMCKLNHKYGSNVCGEGGEYETFTLDCPLFKRKIVIDESEVVIHSDDAFAPVGFLRFKKMHVQEKELAKGKTGLNLNDHTCTELFDKLQVQPDNVTKTEQDSSAKKELRMKIPARTQQQKKDHVLYSRCGNYIWVSGIYGHCTIDGKTLSIEDVTRNVLQSLQDTLTGLEADLCNGMVVHLFVKNMDDFVKINSVYKTFFTVNPPARACIQLNLPEDIAIQVDCLVFAAQSADASIREAMHVQSISHWAPANIGPYSQATKAGGTIFVSGSIGLWPPTMTLIPGGISKEAPLSLQHVDRVISALNPAESLQSVVHGFCFLTSPAYVSVAKNVWCQKSNAKSEDSIAQDQAPMGLMSYIIVPALPKGALVEWHVVALENQMQRQYDSSSLCRESFSVDVQSIAVKGKSNSSIALSIAVECTSTECNLEEVMETFVSELQCCTSQHNIRLAHLMYMRIFYVKDIMDHWQAQDFIHRSLEWTIVPAPAFSLIPVDALEKERTVMLFCCFLQKPGDSTLEYDIS